MWYKLQFYYTIYATVSTEKYEKTSEYFSPKGVI